MFQSYRHRAVPLFWRIYNRHKPRRRRVILPLRFGKYTRPGAFMTHHLGRARRKMTDAAQRSPRLYMTDYLANPLRLHIADFCKTLFPSASITILFYVIDERSRHIFGPRALKVMRAEKCLLIWRGCSE